MVKPKNCVKTDVAPTPSNRAIFPLDKSVMILITSINKSLCNAGSTEWPKAFVNHIREASVSKTGAQGDTPYLGLLCFVKGHASRQENIEAWHGSNYQGRSGNGLQRSDQTQYTRCI